MWHRPPSQDCSAHLRSMPWSACLPLELLRRLGPGGATKRGRQPASAALAKFRLIARGTLKCTRVGENDAGASVASLSACRARWADARAHGAARLRPVRAHRDRTLAPAVADLARGEAAIPDLSLEGKPVAEVAASGDDAGNDGAFLLACNQRVDQIDLVHGDEL